MARVTLPFIPALLLILLAAGGGRALSKRFRQPVILGELVLGMVLGQVVVLADPEPISKLADIGVLLLLFSTGLGLSFHELKRLEVASSVVATAGVVLPFGLGYLASTLFGLPKPTALFVGTALVATSVGVNASILTELRMLHTKLGTLIMETAVIDDVIGVFMISAVVGLITAGGLPVGKLVLMMVLTVALFFISLTWLVRLGRRLSEMITLGREDLLLLGLVGVLAFGLLSEQIGLSAIIGAFLIGLVMGQTHFARRLREYVSFLGGGFFIPVFFITLGMNFDLRAFYSVGGFALLLLAAAILGKVVGCGAGARLSKFNSSESFAVGVAMIPRAGVELVLIKLGLQHGLIGAEIASALLVMVIVTSLITPSLLVRALERVKKV